MAKKTQKLNVIRAEARRQRRELAKMKERPGVKVLPDELIVKIANLLDGPSSVCFALTSSKHYDTVKDIRKSPLKALYPSFEVDDHQPEAHRKSMIARANGDRSSEAYIRLLWHRLGKSCVYCGTVENDAREWDRNEWTYTRHVCRGWLEVNRDLMARYEYREALLSFKVDIGISKLQFEVDQLQRRMVCDDYELRMWEGNLVKQAKELDYVAARIKRFGFVWTRDPD